MSDLPIDEKALILFKNGFLWRADMADPKRIQERWLIYKHVPQTNPRSPRGPQAK